MTLKRFVPCLLGVFVLIVCSATTGHGQIQYSKQEREVLDIEHRWAEAYVHNDADYIASIIAEDFLGSRDGVKKWIEDIRSRRLTRESVSHENVKVRVYGKTAVLRGIAVVKGTDNDKDISGRYQFMDVFARRHGRWVVIASQAAPVLAK